MTETAGTTSGTRVAVLGTGLMGAGMARSMARAGLSVRVWNRTRQKALPLEEAGITVVGEAAEAVEGANVVVTMLFDEESTGQVMRPLLASMAGHAVWAQCATVGIEGTERLAALAAEHGVTYVDAPVLGTRAPAEKGEVIVLAGGPASAKAQVTPVFDAIGSRTVWIGEEPGAGHRLKLVANAWVLSVTAATAQSVGLAERLGLDPRQFLETIAGGPLDCAYTQMKGTSMIEGKFAPSFSLAGAVKDAGLVEQAAQASGSRAELMTALRGCFEAAAERGDPEGEDMAAVIRAFT